MVSLMGNYSVWRLGPESAEQLVSYWENKSVGSRYT
jgi:hypothetical protein